MLGSDDVLCAVSETGFPPVSDGWLPITTAVVAVSDFGVSCGAFIGWQLKPLMSEIESRSYMIPGLDFSHYEIGMHHRSEESDESPSLRDKNRMAQDDVTYDCGFEPRQVPTAFG